MWQGTNLELPIAFEKILFQEPEYQEPLRRSTPWQTPSTCQ